MARRFAREGYIACVTRRSADKLQPLVDQIRADGGQAHGIASNTRTVDDRVALVQQIERDIAPVEVTVFNIGANVRFGITDTTARVYFKVWAMACFGGFLMGRECTRVMVPRGRGTNVFTGVTASLRGRDGFAAFAGAKHACAGPEHGARVVPTGHPQPGQHCRGLLANPPAAARHLDL